MTTAAVIGGGVIGGGWAARFLLNGWDVKVFDPAPDARAKIDAVLDNARRSLPGLLDMALPGEGQLRLCNSIAEAAQDADWVQESVPERLDIKQQTLAEIQRTCLADAVIGSSTSGFKPSQLQQWASRPGQIMVCHPFNPVYLLPLVEVVAPEACDSMIVDRALAMLREIGMHPLHLRKEVDAHVADRLLEAVWREALWLVNDGIATTAEIDDAVRLGFGLRWAQMGLFETYRIAGGEAGMAHFLAQFGPALHWPWSKLTDVPELTDALVARIAEQSEAQSGNLTLSELERLRDTNLVAILRALKAQNHGAGAVLAAQERHMRQGHELGQRADDIQDPAAPVLTLGRVVPLDWTDYNGHMTEAKYLQAFGEATDRFMEVIGCDAAYIASGRSYFTAETHIRHLDEAHAGMVLKVHTRVLGGGGKKMHLWHEMRVGERLVSTGEHFLLHVSLETRKPCDPSAAIETALRRFAMAQSVLPKPQGVGRSVGSPR